EAPPPSPRGDPQSSCLPAKGGIQGPNSKLLKRAKRKLGLSVKRGKPTRRHCCKAAFGRKNLVKSLMCSQ
ncbi:hypothetical protein Ancab_008105, partial [Ancistrocladus abbreviatus]